MELKSLGIVFIVFTSFVLGTVLFLYGFFPLSHNSSDERSTFNDVPEFLDDLKLNNSRYQKHLSYVILMIVDAMRYDFVAAQNFEYVFDQIKNQQACIFKMKVDIPTVTMPKIKSITTGTVSNFIDVILNLGSTEVNYDSIIHQMYDRGDKIVFYGDNTWTKLFPGMFYRKQENFDSFYVRDFYEGDKNITKRLSSELKYRDWDLLLLHYLGLDHIGHVEGSFSPKIPEKLREMDRIVQQMHTSLRIIKENIEHPSLLLVTADHGMRNAGGHGGSSIGEIYIPFISFGTHCNGETKFVYNQIDITPTLAVLLGFPIPSASIGSIIIEMIEFLDPEDQLFNLFYNTKRLIDKAILKFGKERVKFSDYYAEFKSAKSSHKNFLNLYRNSSIEKDLLNTAKWQYKSTSKTVSELLAASFIHFDILTISLGLIQSLYSSILLILIAFILKNENIIKIKILPCFLFILFGIIAGQSICRCDLIESNLCSQGFHTNIIFGMLALFGCINLQILKALKLSHFKLPSLLLIGTIFHGFSLFSSSFIEEEHQTWYYIVKTCLVILAIKEYTSTKLKLKNFTHLKQFSLKRILSVFLYDENVDISINNISKKAEDLDLKKIQEILKNTIFWIVILILNRFICNLNQTGDKWSHIPDIGDWFILEENKKWLSLFLFGALVFLAIIIKDYNGILTNVLSFTAIILIYHYRTITGSVLLFDLKESSSKISLIIFWINLLEIFAINYIPVVYQFILYKKCSPTNIKNCLGANVTIFCLISVLLHKPHNGILVPVCILTLQMVFLTCDRLFNENNTLICKIILSYWIGKSFYFCQGNSNSLASIDLNPGYIGLDSYNPIIVGLLVTLNTYSGPLCCFTLLLYNIFNETSFKKSNENISYMLILTSVMVIFPVSIYLFIVTAFRFHIFIWTVFSPKLLYECFSIFFYHIILFLSYSFLKLVTII